MSHGPKDNKDRPGEGCPRVERLLLRPEEAAEALAVGRTKFYDLMNAGEVPWVYVGHSRRVPLEALRQFIRTKLAERA